VPVSQISLFEDLPKPIENILISLFHAAVAYSGKGHRSALFDYDVPLGSGYYRSEDGESIRSHHQQEEP
jgi:hypothetical protein